MKNRDDKKVERKEETEGESLYSALPCVVFFPDLSPLSSKNRDSLPKSSILKITSLGRGMGGPIISLGRGFNSVGSWLQYKTVSQNPHC